MAVVLPDGIVEYVRAAQLPLLAEANIERGDDTIVFFPDNERYVVHLVSLVGPGRIRITGVRVYVPWITVEEEAGGPLLRMQQHHPRYRPPGFGPDGGFRLPRPGRAMVEVDHDAGIPVLTVGVL